MAGTDKPPIARQTTAPVVSIVMVSYHTGPTLKTSIESILKQSLPFELILVDNGNPPDMRQSLTALADSKPNVHLYTGHGNVGFAKGCNIGARTAKGDYILLLNPDTELPDNALESLVTEGRALLRPWLLGVKILNDDGSEQRGSRRDQLTPWNAFVEATKLHKIFPNNPKFARFNFNEAPCPKERIEVPVISGAFMFMPREDYLAIGGLDERFFLHVEDVDFCYRFGKAGGTVYFTPHVQVLHHQGTSDAPSGWVEWCKARGADPLFLEQLSRPILQTVFAFGQWRYFVHLCP